MFKNRSATHAAATNAKDVIYDICFASDTELYVGDSAATTIGVRLIIPGSNATANHTGDLLEE